MICPRCKDVFLQRLRMIDQGQVIDISRTENGLSVQQAIVKSHQTLRCPQCWTFFGKYPERWNPPRPIFARASSSIL